jgi:hypothetical protein
MKDKNMKKHASVFISIKEIEAAAYRRGINEGVATARRIMAWYSKNHQLLEPCPIETLDNWSNDEICKLENKTE